MASLTSREQQSDAGVLRAASVVVAPACDPTTFIQGIQSQLDTAVDLAVHPQFAGKPLTAQMTHPLNTSTRGGLFIDKIRFAVTSHRSIRRYRIETKLVDSSIGLAVISVEQWTMLAAWNDFQHLLEEAGECNTCGIILYAEDGRFRCQECEMRSLLRQALAVECCVCVEERCNMYNLCCGHQLCYGCAKSVRECPQCSAPFTLCRGLKEKVEDRIDDDDFEVDYGIAISSDHS